MQCIAERDVASAGRNSTVRGGGLLALVLVLVQFIAVQCFQRRGFTSPTLAACEKYPVEYSALKKSVLKQGLVHPVQCSKAV